MPRRQLCQFLPQDRLALEQPHSVIDAQVDENAGGFSAEIFEILDGAVADDLDVVGDQILHLGGAHGHLGHQPPEAAHRDDVPHGIIPLEDEEDAGNHVRDQAVGAEGEDERRGAHAAHQRGGVDAEHGQGIYDHRDGPRVMGHTADEPADGLPLRAKIPADPVQKDAQEGIGRHHQADQHDAGGHRHGADAPHPSAPHNAVGDAVRIPIGRKKEHDGQEEDGKHHPVSDIPEMRMPMPHKGKLFSVSFKNALQGVLPAYGDMQRHGEKQPQRQKKHQHADEEIEEGHLLAGDDHKEIRIGKDDGIQRVPVQADHALVAVVQGIGRDPKGGGAFPDPVCIRAGEDGVPVLCVHRHRVQRAEHVHVPDDLVDPGVRQKRIQKDAGSRKLHIARGFSVFIRQHGAVKPIRFPALFCLGSVFAIGIPKRLGMDGIRAAGGADKKIVGGNGVFLRVEDPETGAGQGGIHRQEGVPVDQPRIAGQNRRGRFRPPFVHRVESGLDVVRPGGFHLEDVLEKGGLVPGALRALVDAGKQLDQHDGEGKHQKGQRRGAADAAAGGAQPLLLRQLRIVQIRLPEADHNGRVNGKQQKPQAPAALLGKAQKLPGFGGVDDKILAAGVGGAAQGVLPGGEPGSIRIAHACKRGIFPGAPRRLAERFGGQRPGGQHPLHHGRNRPGIRVLRIDGQVSLPQNQHISGKAGMKLA